MAGRCGTAPPGAGSPVRGQAAGGAVVVVVVGFTLAAAWWWGGSDEQALRSSPVSPAVASTPQASGRRALERSVSELAIAGHRSYGGGAREWWHPRWGRDLVLPSAPGYSGRGGAGGRTTAGGWAGVDRRPIAARTAEGGGGAKAEAAVDVLHGAADHVGHTGSRANDDDGGDGARGPEQRHEAGRAAGEHTTPVPPP